MRIVTLRPPAERGAGLDRTRGSRVGILLESGEVLPLGALAEVSPTELPAWISSCDLRSLLETDPDLGAIRDALDLADPAALAAAALPRTELRIGPPIPAPSKVVGVGYNYLEHVQEQGIARPERPLLFGKFASCVIGDGDPICRPPGTHALDMEAELAIIIGRRARRVNAANGLHHVAGFCVGNDVTARDWQGQKVALRPGEKGDPQWVRAKASDTFCPLGPALVTADEVGDGRGRAVRSWLTPATDRPGGVPAGKATQFQNGTTADLMFGVAELVAMISTEVTLEPGDVILTGTPSGVGVFREPPVFLEPGDLVRIEVEGLGSLVNPVADEDGRIPEGSPGASFVASFAGGAAE